MADTYLSGRLNRRNHSTPVVLRMRARQRCGSSAGRGNLFAYVSNDPVNLRDPLGLFCIGGSAYVGFGGGLKVCCTWDGCSACAEVGLGWGTKVQAGGGGLDHTGLNRRRDQGEVRSGRRRRAA
jgi:hypothetical protein